MPVTIDIGPDQRVFITGKTGSGKTYLARRLLRQCDRLVVLDSKGTLTDWGLEEWDAESRRRLADGEDVRIRVALDVGRDPDRFWSGVMEQVYQAGDVILYIDEAYQVADERESRRLIEGIWTRGREFHVGAWAASQRPRWLPRMMISESEHFFMFRLHISDDRRFMGEFMGEDVLAQIPPSDRYGFWYYDVYRLRPQYVPALPVKAETAELVTTAELARG